MTQLNSHENSDTLFETINLSKLTQEKVLSSFRTLFTKPELLSKIEEKIDSMENGISKQLMEATLRRIQNIGEGTNQIHRQTHAKLERLMNHIDVNQNVVA